MKKLFLILFLVVGYFANGQILQEPNVYGYKFKRVGSDSLHFIPSDTLQVPTRYNGLSFIANKGGKLYYWNGVKWILFSEGSSYTFTNGITESGGVVSWDSTNVYNEIGAKADSLRRSGLSVQMRKNGNWTTQFNLPDSTKQLTVGNIDGFGSSSDGATIHNDTLYMQLFGSEVPGLVPSSPMDTIHYLRADGSWQIPATGGATPAGNYGNIQLNRNGVLATPASDSLTYNSGELRINIADQGAYPLQVAGNGYFKGSSIVIEPNAGTIAFIQMKDQAGGLSYLSSDLGLSYIVNTGSYAHNFYNNGILTLQIKNISGTSTGGGIETSTSQISSSYVGTGGADKGAYHLERTINEGATGNNHHGFVSKTTFNTGNASFNSFYAQDVIGRTTDAQGHWAGVQTRIQKVGNNTVGDLYDFAALGSLIDTGTVTNRYGFKLWDATITAGATLTNQYGVYIPALTGGSTNHGIVSLTKSAFGVASADSMLKTTSFHATSGMRGSGLPTGKQAYILMADANGTFYMADSTGLWAGGGGGSSSPGGSDTYVQFNDGGSFGGDAGMTYNKTTNALKVAGSAGDITSWFNTNSGNSVSTTLTNPGVFWLNGGAGSMYGATLGYHSGYGTEIFTGNSTSFFFSRGGGNNTSNGTVAMTLNASDELIIANGITDGGDYKLQVNGNGYFNGSVGVGIAPTSRLTLPAGGTAASTAPLKFTTQAAGLTAVEQGAMELIGNSLQFTQLAKRRGVVMSQNVRTSNLTCDNTTTETAAIVTAEHGANYLEVGKCEVIRVVGKLSQRNGANAFIKFRIKYAGVTVDSVRTPINTTIAAGSSFELISYITCRSTGATGTAQVNTILRIDGVTNSPDSNPLVTINTTTAQDFTITAVWGEANASNLMTVNQGHITCIEPSK